MQGKRFFYPKIEINKTRWQALLLFASISTLFTPARFFQLNPGVWNFSKALLLGILLSTITCVFLWALLNFLVKNKGNNVFNLSIIILLFSIGGVRGYFLQLFATKIGLESTLGFSAGLWVSAIHTSSVFLGSVIFYELISQKSDLFSDIFKDTRSALALSSWRNAPMIPSETYNKTVGSLGSAMQEYLSDDPSMPLSQERIRKASEELQRQINELLRPISHRILVSSVGKIEHIGSIKILGESFKELDFSIRLTLAYQFIIGANFISIFLGPRTTLVATVFAIPTSLIIYFGYKRISDSLVKSRSIISCGFLISAAVFPVLAPGIYLRKVEGFENFALGLFATVTIPLFIFLSSVYNHVNRDRDLALAAVATIGVQVEQQMPLLQARNEEIELAGYFHNSLQANLFSIAKRLELISKRGSDEGAKELLDNLSYLLSLKYEDTQKQELRGFSRIIVIIDSWQGICDISISGHEDLELDDMREIRLVEVIEEIVTNAIRHGGASRLEIQLQQLSDGIEVICIHNGDGEILKGGGTGHQLMAIYLKEPLNLEKTENGARLRMLL